MIRFLFKFVVYSVLLLVVAATAAVFLLAEDRPLVAQETAPTASDVRQARAFVQGVREAASDATGSQEFVTTPRQLNSVIRLGARIFPGFRGAVTIEGDSVLARASVPLPLSDRSRWVNLRASVPGFDSGLVVDRLEIGPLSVPPMPVLSTARVAANALVGNDFGSTLLGAAESMRVDADRVVFVMAMDGVGSNGIMRGLFGTLRGSAMPDSAVINAYYVDLRDAIETGDLPVRGSYLPYVVHTLNAALDGAPEQGLENAFTAAIFALTLACGAQDFTLVTGFDKDASVVAQGNWRTSCDNVTFNDRIDARRHFTTAAALQAASNRGFAVSVGEFKELYDSGGGSGFDFTDIAANNSGIRLANRMMRSPAAQWPALIARIETERDVIMSFDGMQRGISEREFIAKYGEVDSPAYLAKMAEIEAKIDALALHQ